VAADQFTVADIVISHCLAWAQSAKVEVVPAQLLNYMDTHWSRPAAQRARVRETRPASKG
jgi:glutathione S-transferase